MNKPLVAFWAVALSILGLGLYGFLEGVPETDIAYAARSGNLEKVQRLLKRDPNLANAKVYPQAHERRDQRRAHELRTGESAWEGRYVIHEVTDVSAEEFPLLEALVAAGARLDVRLAGRTLLHDAAYRGNTLVADWLIGRGADVNAANDCKDRCAESGWTPMHNALRFRPAEMIPLLVSRGASIDKAAAEGRTALHLTAAGGSLEGAFILCRHGADLSRKDAKGNTPLDLALKAIPPGVDLRTLPHDPGALLHWLRAGGGCEEVSALARRNGTPVSEDDARVVYTRHDCARPNRPANAIPVCKPGS